MPLGSLLGPPKALLGGSWTPKTLKNCRVFKVFANATFWVFGVCDGRLGSILALLGPIWSQNGYKNSPKSGPNSVQKLVQKMTPQKVNFEPILDPKMGSKIGLNP